MFLMSMNNIYTQTVNAIWSYGNSWIKRSLRMARLSLREALKKISLFDLSVSALTSGTTGLNSFFLYFCSLRKDIFTLSEIQSYPELYGNLSPFQDYTTKSRCKVYIKISFQTCRDNVYCLCLVFGLIQISSTLALRQLTVKRWRFYILMWVCVFFYYDSA